MLESTLSCLKEMEVSSLFEFDKLLLTFSAKGSMAERGKKLGAFKWSENPIRREDLRFE